MKNWAKVVWSLSGLMLSGVVCAGEIPLKDFARYEMFDDVEISPDGRHLAVTVPVNGQRDLVVLDTETLKVTGRMQAWDRNDIGDVWWVNPERVMASLNSHGGSLDTRAYSGELVAMNADGSQQRYLFGYRDTAQSRLSGTKPDLAFGSPLNTIEGDPNHILISVRGWGDGADTPATVYKLDVYTGATQRVLTAPAPGDAEFLADRKGQVRYAVVTDHNWVPHAFWRESNDADWKQEDVGKLAKAVIEPLRFSDDGKSVYLRSTETGDKACLVRRDLGDQGHREVLACDDDGDLRHVIWSFDKKEPIAAVFEAGYPTLKLLPNTHPDRETLKSLVASFGGQWVAPVSATKDGGKVVLLVASDRNPGDFYLFDNKTHKAQYLLTARKWIDPEKMAERRAISYKTRDDHTIWGYLTLPKDKKPSQLPLVAFVHGGPFGIRDNWFWERDAQMLASRGYAVLQVNFRGSGGYGKSHKESAKRAWGTMMIDDITDGTRWAVAQGYADPRRLCIYGGSYGGYAALMSAVREPDLYRCTVVYAGVSDLQLLKRDSDTGETSAGRNFISEYIGATNQELRDASPLTYIDKLKAAIMIVHGDEDRRVPYNQAKALRSALEDRKYPYEWLVKHGEYHGFYLEKNNEELFEKLIAFLDKSIGKDAVVANKIDNPSVPAAVPAASTEAVQTANQPVH